MKGLTQLFPNFNAFGFAGSACLSRSAPFSWCNVPRFKVQEMFIEEKCRICCIKVKRGETDTQTWAADCPSASLISPLHEVCSSIAHDHVVQSNVLALLLPFAPPHPLLARRRRPAACLPACPPVRRRNELLWPDATERASASLTPSFPLCTIDFDIPRYIPTYSEMDRVSTRKVALRHW